ncbi:MAG TPA: nucleotidyltransferase family protein [Vicinamibacteria bacterium]|nr:nucleotidyltransferase family protein [Vicinamibacteria bacterium]
MLELLLGAGCAALAFRRLKGDDPRLEALHEAHRLTALQARMREAPLARAFGALRDAGIEPILGKGWAAARLYPATGLRPMGDIDLYVPEADAPRALEALRASGDSPVDLHAGFAELDDRSAAELHARSVRLSVGGGTVRVFSPEDHLRLLCLHLLRHGAIRPLWLVDVALAVETRPAAFDWGRFLAGDPWRTEAARHALALAGSLLGARLDGVPLSGDPPRWLASAVRREWGRGRPPHGARTPIAVERPARWPRALAVRWPNAVEATYAIRAPWRRVPRLPIQLAAAARRAAAVVQ